MSAEVFLKFATQLDSMCLAVIEFIDLDQVPSSSTSNANDYIISSTECGQQAFIIFHILVTKLQIITKVTIQNIRYCYLEFVIH